MCMMLAGLLGAGVSAMGSIAQGNAQADAYHRQAQEQRTQAQLDQRQSAAEEISGQYQQRQMADQANKRAGAQIAAYAGAGGVALAGSPTDTIIDSRRESMLDIGAIKYNTDLKADNQMWKARQSASNADDADAAAEKAKQAGMIGAFSSILGGFSKLGGGF